VVVIVSVVAFSVLFGLIIRTFDYLDRTGTIFLGILGGLVIGVWGFGLFILLTMED